MKQLTVNRPNPRNRFAVLARHRGGGAHCKSIKRHRQDATRRLRHDFSILAARATNRET